MLDPTTHCQKCELPYSSYKPRVTFYPDGVKVDWCLKCGADWEREKLSTGQKSKA